MEGKNLFKDIYDDFFGIEKLKRENEKLREELNISDDYPVIEVEEKSIEEKESNIVSSKEDKDKKMTEFFEVIDNLYISDDSKNMLKKMIEYARKYNEGIEKQFIPFNMCVYSNDKDTINKIIELVNDFTIYFSYARRADCVQASLYTLEKVDAVEEIYSDKNSIIVFKDLEGLNAQEQIFKDKFWHRIEEKNLEREKWLTIIIADNKEVINAAFDKNENILDNFINFEIIGINPDVQDVYQEVLSNLENATDISEDFSVALLDYITITFPNYNGSYSDYKEKLIQKLLFNKKDVLTKDDIPEYEKDKTTEEIFAELNELVGLKKVKQVLQDLVSLMELKEKAQDELKIKNTNLHMVFLGNPGTGKTTVARIVAEILYNLKYIKQNKLIEVSSKDLVAEYVGQTAPKTMKVIQKAMGGVLFIDEAYSLASGKGQGNSYNEEAIATLIQAMENYRDNLVVIFAGYTKEMQDFLNSNSGIVSRIGYTLEFDDYTEDELIDIFKQMTSKAGFVVEEDAINKLREIIREYKDSENFGNARFIRNVYEKTIIKHASNTKGKKRKSILKTIRKEDISVENLLK